MPWATPPCTCPSTSSGFSMRPQSSTTTKRSVAADGRAAAGERADPVGAAVRVALAHLHVGRRNAQLAGDDLGQDGLQALPMAGRADSQAHPAGGVDGNGCLLVAGHARY